MPLSGKNHRIAGFAVSSAYRIAAVRSGKTIYRVPDGMPFRMSERMVPARSVRGLSDVSTRKSAYFAGGGSHQRALFMIPIPAAAEHHNQISSGEGSRRRKDFFNAIRRMRVIA